MALTAAQLNADIVYLTAHPEALDLANQVMRFNDASNICRKGTK